MKLAAYTAIDCGIMSLNLLGGSTVQWSAGRDVLCLISIVEFDDVEGSVFGVRSGFRTKQNSRTV